MSRLSRDYARDAGQGREPLKLRGSVAQICCTSGFPRHPAILESSETLHPVLWDRITLW